MQRSKLTIYSLNGTLHTPHRRSSVPPHHVRNSLGNLPNFRRVSNNIDHGSLDFFSHLRKSRLVFLKSHVSRACILCPSFPNPCTPYGTLACPLQEFRPIGRAVRSWKGTREQLSTSSLENPLFTSVTNHKVLTITPNSPSLG